VAQEHSHPTPEQEVELAREALAQNDLGHAVHHINGALISDPANNDRLMLLHEIIAKAEDPLALVSLEGGHADFATAATRAYILGQRGAYQDALSLLLQVVETRPDVPYLQWASWWLQQTGLVQSLPLHFVAGVLVTGFLKIVAGCPSPMKEDDPRLLNVQIAEYYCGIFREIHPNDSFLYFAGSVLARRLGKFEDALALAQHAHEIEPSWRTCIGIANAYRDMGRADEAVVHFRHALTHDPADMSARLDIGETLLEAGRYQQAISAFQECLEREPDNLTAKACIHYASFKQTGNPADREALLKMRAEGGDNYRACDLADEIDPPMAYVNYLPRCGDASTNAVRSIFEQMYENPAEHHGSTVKIKESHVESPSVVAAFHLQMEMWGPQVGLEWEIETIQQPDPRVPKAQVDFRLWTYDGVQPHPNAAKPDPAVAQEIYEIAPEPYNLEFWEPKAKEIAARLGPGALQSLLGMMVHPPRPPDSDWRVLVWVQRVQVAAALIIAHLDSTWDGSQRKRALYSLLYGPVDWIVDAAIIALGCLARRDPTIRQEVEQAFAWLRAQIPSEGFTCFEYPLVSTWLSLGGHDPGVRSDLESWQEKVLNASGASTVYSAQLMAKKFDMDEEMAKAQAAQQELASGGGGDPDPVVFPGQPVARLSDYVGLMKGMQTGDMMGALSRYGLDMGTYSQVAMAWGQKLQADPTLNAKFAQMMQS